MNTQLHEYERFPTYQIYNDGHGRTIQISAELQARYDMVTTEWEKLQDTLEELWEAADPKRLTTIRPTR